MNLEEYISKLRKQREDIDNGVPLFLAVSSTVASMSKRIFTDGQNVTGDTFNYNTTTSIYANPITSPGKKFPVAGKTGRTVFEGGKKKGQAHKTGWFKSYKTYRDTIGRPTQKVVFNLSGELKSDFENGVKRINNNEYELALKRDINVKKRKWLDERFNTVLVVSKPEREYYQRVYNDEVIRILSR